MLDLSRVLAGPLCTMMLGDLGANVLKVERPATGDEARGWGPPFHQNGLSGYFMSVNRNKKSVALDLDDARDRKLAFRLLEKAHVVVDNFRPGTLERRGIFPEQWLERQPQLVWCSISGFDGETARPGYDFVVQAEQGWMAITGEPDGTPMKTGVALADVVAGKDAAIAVLAALAAIGRGTLLGARERRLRVALARSATAALVNVAQNALITGEEPGRYGNAHANLVPYQLFDTADRPLVLAVGNDLQWRACLNAVGGLDDLAADASLDTNAGRVRSRERIVARIAQRLREKEAAHWIERLRRDGVPCGVVRNALESLRELGTTANLGVPPAIPGSLRLPPPQLDEHGAAVRARGWECFREPG